MLRHVATLTPLFLLCQCTLPMPGRADGIDPNPFQVLEQQAKPVNRDPKRISVPLLHSTTLEKRWGKPKLLVGPKGGYALRYENPGNHSTHLTIFGSPDVFPVAGPVPPPYTDLGIHEERHSFSPSEVSQRWKSLSIAGKNVRYCIAEGGSPGEPFQFSSETFRHTAPDGRTASYRLRAASAKDGEVEHLMETASF